MFDVAFHKQSSGNVHRTKGLRTLGLKLGGIAQYPRFGTSVVLFVSLPYNDENSVHNAPRGHGLHSQFNLLLDSSSKYSVSCRQSETNFHGGGSQRVRFLFGIFPSLHVWHSSVPLASEYCPSSHWTHKPGVSGLPRVPKSQVSQDDAPAMDVFPSSHVLHCFKLKSVSARYLPAWHGVHSLNVEPYFPASEPKKKSRKQVKEIKESVTTHTHTNNAFQSPMTYVYIPHRTKNHRSLQTNPVNIFCRQFDLTKHIDLGRNFYIPVGWKLQLHYPQLCPVGKHCMRLGYPHRWRWNIFLASMACT